MNHIINSITPKRKITKMMGPLSEGMFSSNLIFYEKDYIEKINLRKPLNKNSKYFNGFHIYIFFSLINRM